MTKSVQKIALSTSRDIPFDKLVLAQSNVRHVKAGVGIEQLAENIARRTLLQNLTVRAVVGLRKTWHGSGPRRPNIATLRSPGELAPAHDTDQHLPPG